MRQAGSIMKKRGRYQVVYQHEDFTAKHSGKLVAVAPDPSEEALPFTGKVTIIDPEYFSE
jgi:hypothetical protein